MIIVLIVIVCGHTASQLPLKLIYWLVSVFLHNSSHILMIHTFISAS